MVCQKIGCTILTIYQSFWMRKMMIHDICSNQGYPIFSNPNRKTSDTSDAPLRWAWRLDRSHRASWLGRRSAAWDLRPAGAAKRVTCFVKTQPGPLNFHINHQCAHVFLSAFILWQDGSQLGFGAIVQIIATDVPGGEPRQPMVFPGEMGLKMARGCDFALPYFQTNPNQHEMPSWHCPQ